MAEQKEQTIVPVPVEIKTMRKDLKNAKHSNSPYVPPAAAPRAAAINEKVVQSSDIVEQIYRPILESKQSSTTVPQGPPKAATPPPPAKPVTPPPAPAKPVAPPPAATVAPKTQTLTPPKAQGPAPVAPPIQKPPTSSTVAPEASPLPPRPIPQPAPNPVKAEVKTAPQEKPQQQISEQNLRRRLAIEELEKKLFPKVGTQYREPIDDAGPAVKREPTIEKPKQPSTESPAEMPKNPFFKNMTPQTKDTLQSPEKPEEQKRKKFMEDVEQWISQHPSSDQNK